MLDILEESWALYFDTLGHTIPEGADQFRINAYVSGEKDNPSIDYDGGYADLDGEGFTYLVLSSNLVGEPDDDALLATASHEFYHDVQFGTNAYAGETAYWYWEATAEWASQELYPDLDDSYTFVGGFALLTELPIFFAGDALGDDPSGVHQYGASIFPRHLTDRLGSPALVPDSWEVALPEDDPLDVLDGLLPSGTIAEAYAEFAPRMALWDFTRRDLIMPWVNVYAEAYPDEDGIALRVGPDGTGGMVPAPAGREPGGFAANIIELARPASGALDLSIEVDAAGSLGTPGQVTATVVRPVAGTPDVEYTPVAIDAGIGSAQVLLGVNQPIAYLVVAATSATRSLDESFPTASASSRPWPRRPNPDDGSNGADDDDEGGCGCRSGGAPGDAGGAALLLLGAALALRRRSRGR